MGVMGLCWRLEQQTRKKLIFALAAEVQVGMRNSSGSPEPGLQLLLTLNFLDMWVRYMQEYLVRLALLDSVILEWLLPPPDVLLEALATGPKELTILTGGKTGWEVGPWALFLGGLWLLAAVL